MRWNDYIFQANQVATRQYIARRRENAANNRAQNQAIVSRIRDNPTVRDIELGDALNAAIDQLANPRLSNSALRLATAPVEASVIREIAFRNASEGVTFVLSQIKAAKTWPRALEGERFAAQQRDFESILDRAIKEDDEGDVSSDTLKLAHALVSVIRGKLAATPLEGPKARDEATGFIKTFAGLVRLLEKPDTTEALNQLRTVKTTSLGNLIAFMEIYNLRFGQATTPAQRAIYRDLFTQIDAVRSKVVGSPADGIGSSILSSLDPVFDFFGSLFP